MSLNKKVNSHQMQAENFKKNSDRSLSTILHIDFRNGPMESISNSSQFIKS